MECPKCKKEMDINLYHKAVSMGCKFFCHNCKIHLDPLDGKIYDNGLNQIKKF